MPEPSGSRPCSLTPPLWPWRRLIGSRSFWASGSERPPLRSGDVVMQTPHRCSRCHSLRTPPGPRDLEDALASLPPNALSRQDRKADGARHGGASFAYTLSMWVHGVNLGPPRIPPPGTQRRTE